MVQYNGKEYNCLTELGVSIISGKWKMIILWSLMGGSLRFNELQRLFPKISQKVLTDQLRELEKDGLVIRTVYNEIPPKVEYALSELGKALKPVFDAMSTWGNEFLEVHNN